MLTLSSRHQSFLASCTDWRIAVKGLIEIGTEDFKALVGIDLEIAVKVI